ncbi:MAG: DUF481 domain-containing protein, partial [Candidatus Omnitrophica bacterium]|nr:DUF481 domain-containing protein [Candidatus Omnitrophota bacterium]
MKRTIIVITACVLLMNIGGNVSAEEIGWKRKISIGYNQANGNTEKSQLALAGSIKKVMDRSEFFSGVDVFYSESEGKMDSQKWSSTTRYSYDFGEEKRWFNSFQLLVEHDFFADVDYRILPSTGIGSWWAREDDWTLSTEAGLGYNITNYKSAQPDDESVTAYGRIFAKK